MFLYRVVLYFFVVSVVNIVATTALIADTNRACFQCIQTFFPCPSKVPPTCPAIKYYYSSNTQKDVQLYGNETQCLDSNQCVFLLIHGYTECAQKKWLLMLRDAILTARPTCTVIIVDWSEYVIAKDYCTSVNAVYCVADAIVNNLLLPYFNGTCGIDFGYQTVCIGHSLGAQMCGRIGKQLKTLGTPLAAIESLESAAPGFVENHIIPDNAKIVRSYHTASQLGDCRVRGVVDYYINGGKALQPQCLSYNYLSFINILNLYSIAFGVLYGFTPIGYVVCGHQLVIQVYIYSFKNTITAYPCNASDPNTTVFGYPTLFDNSLKGNYSVPFTQSVPNILTQGDCPTALSAITIL